jgi:hypothetical protein
MKVFLITLYTTGLLFFFADARGREIRDAHRPKSKPVLTDTNAALLDGAWHSVKVSPPANLPKISFWNRLNPVWWFGNIDDPIPPAWYRADDKHRWMKWHCRNPFHNFDFYVIGVADKEFVRSGRYPVGNGNPHGGWDFSVVTFKGLPLPFMSYSRGKFNFYLGWRNRGNFGVKLNYSEKRNKKKVSFAPAVILRHNSTL